MRHILTTTIVLLLTAAAWAAAAADEARMEVQTLFARTCIECHGESKPEADLPLSEFNEQSWSDYGLLDALLTKVKAGEMPPDEAKVKLADDDRQQLVQLLQGRLQAIEGSQLGGTLNRLTRSEWCDTLEDLTGVKVEKPYELPIDSSAAMLRIGEHQLLTPLAMRQYQEVANRYAEEVILDTLPEVATYTVDFTKKENQIGNSSNESQPYGIQSHNDLTVLNILSPVTSNPLEGVYEIVFDYYHARRDDPKADGQPTPVVVDKNKHFGRFRSGGEILSKAYTHDLDGQKLHPSGHELFYRFDEPLRVRLTKENKSVSFFVHGGGKVPWVFTGVTLRGPLDKTYPASHEKIFGDAQRDGDLAECTEVLDSLGSRLFRRPVDSEMMAPYHAIAKAEYDRGGNLYSATKLCLKAMLCSPYFIYKETSDSPQLAGRMIATRLSYLLWNTSPDARLMELAEQGKLSDPAIRRAEAQRLLDNTEKVDRFVHLFVHQWLGLDKFADFAPNAAYINPQKLVPLRPSIEEEPYAFFAALLAGNLSARNLIDSDFVVWDKTLTEYYGGDDAGVRSRDLKGQDFQKVNLSKSPAQARERLGGLVAMPIIMSMTTDGETTQPMLRGAWVIKHLIGKQLEPPDSVPAIEVDLSNVDKPKEILRLHKQHASCASCHVKMDYMGLALENYDVMGRWQSNYMFPSFEGNKFEIITKDPVDSLAESPDGQPVDGIGGLKQHLLEREDEIMRNLVEKLFAYALGATCDTTIAMRSTV